MICMTDSIGTSSPGDSPGRPAGATILGWDIGGVNTKVVRWPDLAAGSAPYEIQRAPDALVPTLLGLAGDLDGVNGPHAVTMTAELSQAFRTKREGVTFVLDAVARAFPGAPIGVYTVDGEFLVPEEGRRRPLEVAASNWAATARLVGRSTPDCILVDIGTTSTDIIPITGGEVVAEGRTDPDRLLSGELVYTGAVRTPVEAVAAVVPLRGSPCAVSAEGFAVIGDAHVWCGGLREEDYTSPTPDGRPAARVFAGERLARVVCGDREMLDDRAIDAIAGALIEAQGRTVSEAIRRVWRRHRHIGVAVVAGLGERIAAEAATRAGLRVERLADRLGEAARTAPAAAVACLYAGGAGR
jgi:(4-(4-[2-(gamma-L-glutamylamino)ethyl]phenoxymethyl)furan-2-yl)methanamine synthase